MVSRNLVICDQEERYAAALAHFFMKTKELALGVQVCNSVAQARDCRRNHRLIFF